MSLRVEHDVRLQTLEEFFDGLSEETKRSYGRWFSLDDVRACWLNTLELKRAVFTAQNELVAYGHLDLFPKHSRRYQGSLGLVVADVYQNKGVGAMLLGELLRLARERALKKVWAHIHADNVRSIRLFFNQGFHLEGFFQDDEWYSDRPISVLSVAKFLEG